MEKRRVAAITNDGKFTVIEENIPELKKGEVLVEVKASLISPGTELGCIALPLRKNPKPHAKPRKFGYSNAGIVIKQGPGCEDIPIGMRVACMGGGYALHTDYAVIPRNLMVPIPDGMSFEVASFAHLGATSLHALRRAQLQIGENVLILGLGIIGQIATQICVASNLHVAVIDKLPMRIELAKRVGAEPLMISPDDKEEEIVNRAKKFTRGYGMDCAIISFGGDATEVMKLIVKMMKVAPDTHPMGRIVIVGVANFQTYNWPVSMGNIDVRASSRPGPGYHDYLYEHGQDYPPVFVQWTTKRNMEEVLRMEEEGRINLKMLITHSIPFTDFAKGAEALISSPNEALGVIILY